MAALFGSTVLPEPVRELITVAGAVRKDAFEVIARNYYQLALLKPRLAGIITAGHGYIPEPVGPDVSYVLATAEEIETLQKHDYGAFDRLGTFEINKLVKRVEARPFTWDNNPPPIWGAANVRSDA